MLDVAKSRVLSFFGGAAGNDSRKNKEKYKHLTLGIKQIVLERAKYRCQECSKKLTGSNHPHFVNINGSKKDNRPENLRALCSDCHNQLPQKDSNTMLSSIRKMLSKK
jgi:5-methylcytosine-specific restriction endonuclease McrA